MPTTCRLQVKWMRKAFRWVFFFHSFYFCRSERPIFVPFASHFAHSSFLCPGFIFICFFFFGNPLLLNLSDLIGLIWDRCEWFRISSNFICFNNESDSLRSFFSARPMLRCHLFSHWSAILCCVLHFRFSNRNPPSSWGQKKKKKRTESRSCQAAINYSFLSNYSADWLRRFDPAPGCVNDLFFSSVFSFFETAFIRFRLVVCRFLSWPSNGGVQVPRIWFDLKKKPNLDQHGGNWR